MSRLRQDNVNLHMCHMRMSLKAQTHFNTICNVWVITPHGATQQPATPPDETPTLPPHLRPHHSLCFRTPTSSSPPLTILMLLWGPEIMPPMPPSPPLMPPCTHLLWSAFPTCLQHRLPSLRLHSALLTCLPRCLPSLRLQCPPNMPLTPLTILILVQCPPNMPLTAPRTSLILNPAYDPYAPAAPSR
ncbi:hypothetical protein O181_071073 [Austropuccinia psidii MF-1]|uniref:Uncharacterized protein n=1 Tax=Austropuccinia psidii MF-1 TaxID=1389203 RepID=A0A9Q3F4Z5_9BASI|nr:hypothetical protein [Austropuccinia psidii MF-1]